ncbi:MAG: NAD(+) diphosphatase [Clostridium sp.]|nr:NAD(+) diphosphatase [Clostridium sp.]
MIQEIAPYKYDNMYKIDKVQDEDYVLIFDKNEVIMKKSKENETLPKFKDLKDIHNLNSDDFIYLFKIDDYKFFLFKENDCNRNKDYIKEIVNKSSEINKEESLVKENTVIFRTLQPSWMAFGGITAKHLYAWYSSNRYCGKCGHELNIYDKERALYCEECKNILYPSIAPAVIVGVINKDKILLTKYSRGSYRKYALVAGFVEIGEAVEDTVKREVMEEVGLKVKNIRYFSSQPWGFTNTVLMGYFADIDGDDTVTLEEDELGEGTWFKYDELPERDLLISLTQTMIEEFKNKKGKV